MTMFDSETAPAALEHKACGEITSAGTATQLPDVDGRTVIIKANAANTGVVAVAALATLTVPGNTTDTTSGLPLSAGESVTLTLGTFNLNELYIIAATSGEGVSYLVYG